MRKRVSCRVVTSVPLNQSEDGLINAYPSCTIDPNISGFDGLTHPEHPATMRVYMDAGPATGMLDILA